MPAMFCPTPHTHAVACAAALCGSAPQVKASPPPAALAPIVPSKVVIGTHGRCKGWVSL